MEEERLSPCVVSGYKRKSVSGEEIKYPHRKQLNSIFSPPSSEEKEAEKTENYSVYSPHSLIIFTEDSNKENKTANQSVYSPPSPLIFTEE